MKAFSRHKALDLFHFQAEHNAVYANYIKKIGVDAKQIDRISSIPFLPISLYKTHEIKTGTWNEEHIFLSSGTTSGQRSRHFIRSLESYRVNAQDLFETAFGALSSAAVLALLPGYALESSLVSMVDHFIKVSTSAYSGFFSGEADYEELLNRLQHCRRANVPTLLFGVTHSLLDFAEKHSYPFPKLVVMETGGMKGRRKELTREEIHQSLSTAFATYRICSEYGMTELQSQAYSRGSGLFAMNGRLRVLPGDPLDPLSPGKYGQVCRLNIIDLANTSTCAFIATADLGRVFENGTFEVLGRKDNAEIRGCNLLFS